MPTFLNPKRISAGYRACSYIDRDGAAYVWGDAGTSGVLGLGDTTDYSTPTSLSQPGSYPWALINLGKTHSAGIDTNGDAWCWGNNSEGQFGDNSTTSDSSPVAVSGSHTFVKIVPGNYFTVAIDDSGDLYAWGTNDAHELGDGTTTPSSIPKLISSSKTWIDIACGYSWTIALADDGTVWGWGANYQGEAGNGTYETAVTTPQQYSLPSSTWAIAIACFSTGIYSTVYILLSNGEIWGAGCGSLGQLGDGTTEFYNPTLTRVAPAYTFRSITSGDGSCFGVTTDGELLAWGEGSDGELGNEASSDSSTPVTVSGDHYFSEYAAGNGVTIAITEFGDQVFTWGNCVSGALGNSETSGIYNYPITIDSPLVAPDGEMPLPLGYMQVEPIAVPGEISISGTLPTLYGQILGAAVISGSLPLLSGEMKILSAFDISGTLPLLTGHIYSGDMKIEGDLPLLSGTLDIVPTNPLEISGTLPLLTGQILGAAEIAGTLPLLTGSITTTTEGFASIAGTIPLLRGTMEVLGEGRIEISGSLPLLTVTATITGENVAAITGTIPLLVGSVELVGDNRVVISGSIPLLTGDMLVSIDNILELSGNLPLLKGSVSLESSYTDSTLRYVRPS